MSKSSLQIVHEFEESLKISIQELKKQYKTILGAGAAELKKETKKELIAAVPAASRSSRKYDDRLIDAVRSFVMKDEENPEAYVHIMGTRKSKSGTFRARFFESGTQERTIKSGKFSGKKVGKIESKGFFEKAITRSGGKIVSAADSRLAEIIRKINEENQ